MSQKQYAPHFIIIWSPLGVAVKEIPYKEDAYEEYNELIQKGVQTIALAKLVRKHNEG